MSQDLLWDNFDGVMRSTNNDINLWLSNSLNKDTAYDNKIIAYYGYVDSESAEYKTIVNQVYDNGPGILLAESVPKDDHKRLLYASIAINYGLYKAPTSPYARNDGLVPVQSAAFNGHTVAKQVECPGFDHLEMKDGGQKLEDKSEKLCANGLTLFKSISRDLSQIGVDSGTTSKAPGVYMVGESPSTGGIRRVLERYVLNSLTEK